MKLTFMTRFWNFLTLCNQISILEEVKTCDCLKRHICNFEPHEAFRKISILKINDLCDPKGCSFVSFFFWKKEYLKKGICVRFTIHVCRLAWFLFWNVSYIIQTVKTILQSAKLQLSKKKNTKMWVEKQYHLI